MAEPVRSLPVPDPSREYQPLVIVLAAVCTGIVTDRFWGPPLVVWMSLALVAGFLWCGLWLWRRQKWAMLPLLVALAGVGGAWHHLRWYLFATADLGLFAREASEPVCVEAVALNGPRRVPAPPPNAMRAIPVGDRTRVELRVTAVRDGDLWRPVSGLCTLTVEGHLLDVQAGDRLRIVGQLNTVHHPDNPGGFDFATYARADRQLCVIWSDYPECVSHLQRASGWSIRRGLDLLRSRGDALLWQYLDPERSGLAAAMFLGLREELDPDQSQAFLETGTVHLLVISGLNVAILATCLSLALRIGLLPRRAAFLAVALFTITYAVVTDAQPPVVRATIMVLVFCVARSLGREALGLNSLAAAALGVLLLNPAELFRAGTQLSFLSVAAMSWTGLPGIQRRVEDPLDRLIALTRPWPLRFVRHLGSQVWQTTATSALIWLVVLPLVMSRFHLASPAAIMLGPILALPVALAMACGFGVLLLGWLVPLLGTAFGWLCDLNLLILDRAVAFARPLPGSHAWVAGPSDWWLVGFYGGLALWAIAPRLRPPARWCLALAAGWCALGLGISAWSARPTDRLACTFISVGHGCSVLLETPSGQKLLYDAGRLGSPITPARSIACFLWSRGITRLDAVVLSHADADHYNALPKLLEQFSVGAIYVSPMMFDDISGGVAVLHQGIVDSRVPVREVWGGDRLRAGRECRIDVLHPQRRGVLGSDNANSIVMAVEFAGRRLLLTGDLEPPGLNDVLAETPIDCDVLLAPHHGSSRSDPKGLARWCAPEWVVISSGEADNLDTVLTDYAAAGARVLPTSKFGAVQVAIDRERLAVDWWRK